MRRIREIACRFDLDPQDCVWLHDTLARFGACPTEEIRDFALYLDTRRAEIGNCGLALSLRRGGETAPQDLKSAVASVTAGMSAPHGWVQCIEPLFAAIPCDTQYWMNEILQRSDPPQRLRILFQLDTQTSRWDIQNGDSDISIRIERARVSANRAQATFATATFLSKAEPQEFFRLLEELSVKLRMSAEGTALRGYRFCAALRDLHVTAFAPNLTAGMDAVTAFRTIARGCVDHFLLNEAAIRDKRDGEAVHQCRVALRRLSTSLRFFASVVSGDGRKALRPGFKKLRTHFRKARDLDVLIADVIVPATGSGFSEAMAHLLRDMEERRDLAYDELVATLSAPSTAALLLHAVGWIEAGDWNRDPERKARRREKISRFAERKLAKAAGKFKRRCARLREANQEERHRIRIRAKNLRYGGEFFETLIEATHGKAARRKKARKRFRNCIAALKDLQAVLGKQNDIGMAQRFLGSLAQEIGASRTDDLVAIETLRARIDVSRTEIRRKAGKACRALTHVKPFWSGLRRDT